MFSLVYAGKFNSQHVEDMDSIARRVLLKRLLKQKQLEEDHLKKARAKAKMKKPRKR